MGKRKRLKQTKPCQRQGFDVQPGEYGEGLMWKIDVVADWNCSPPPFQAGYIVQI